MPKTAAFYRDVLGFHEVKRPSSFEFEGAWQVSRKQGSWHAKIRDCTRFSASRTLRSIEGAEYTAAAFAARVAGARRCSEASRPGFRWDGEWIRPCRLFNYGVGIHLIAGQPLARNKQIDPKADHLSFQVRTPYDCPDPL